jgi:hypothetical protein
MPDARWRRKAHAKAHIATGFEAAHALGEATVTKPYEADERRRSDIRANARYASLTHGLMASTQSLGDPPHTFQHSCVENHPITVNM